MELNKLTRNNIQQMKPYSSARDEYKDLKKNKMGKFVNPKKIKGQDKLNRIKDLMGKMNTLNESTSHSELELVKKGPNGVVYGIVRENRNYFIKTYTKTNGELKSNDFDYVGELKKKGT